MKLIKINPDHYLVVDNSEIKEGDWFYNPATKEVLYASKDMLSWNNDTSQEHKGWKKITHSTQPLEVNNLYRKYDFINIKSISLSEVKELIGEVDVEKKAINSWEGCDSCDTNDELFFINGYQRGYKQALEDNKEKKYTRNEVHGLMCKAFIQGWKKADIVEAGLEGLETDVECAWILTRHDSAFKTEWEVEFVDGKLKLK